MRKIIWPLPIIFLFVAAIIFLPKNNPTSSTQKDNQNAAPPKTLSFFASILKKKPTVTEEKTVTLIAAGDVMPGRSVNYHSVQQNDFTWPFAKTAEILKSADIAFINLESPFVDNCPLTNGGMIFCSDKRNIQGLTFAGIDIVNIANNHIANFGQEGIKQTRRLLKTNYISLIGTADGAVFKTVNTIRFGFLGYNDFASPPGISQANKEKIATDIAGAKAKADIVVVSFHWGEEYTDKPSKRQQELAHLVIDSGADLVIGHHPHWVQPTEKYKDKLIIYSLGNFIFDQFWSQKTKEGVVGKFKFSGNKLIWYELLPIEIDNFGQPSFRQNLE